MFTNHIRAAVAVVALSQFVGGCTDSPRTSLTSPSVVTAPAPVPVPTPTAAILTDATLSGMVYEIVGGPPGQRRGIEGASVYCEACGESTHNFAYTDSNGEYVFPHGVWMDRPASFPIRVSVGKDGYQDPPGLPKTTPPNPSGPGWREVLIAGDTRFEIELVAR